MTTTTDLSKTHEFLVSGCRNQWHANHDHADCWDAFLKHHDAPAGMGVGEFYDWLDRGRKSFDELSDGAARQVWR